jgi:hypothetical protein
MWEPRRLTILWAFTAWYGESFTASPWELQILQIGIRLFLPNLLIFPSRVSILFLFLSNEFPVPFLRQWNYTE